MWDQKHHIKNQKAQKVLSNLLFYVATTWLSWQWQWAFLLSEGGWAPCEGYETKPELNVFNLTA